MKHELVAKGEKKVGIKEENIAPKYLQQKTCNDCGIKLSCKSSYDLHMKVQHKGRPRFSCSLCNNVYSYKHALKYHYDSMHLGITYSCDNCGKTFKYDKEVKRHKRKRCPKTRLSNEDPLKVSRSFRTCRKCYMVFSTKCEISNHIRAVH